MSAGKSSLAAGLAQVRKPGEPRAAATPPPAANTASPSPRPQPARQTFDERTARRTFHLDNELWDDLSAAAERTGMSKSQLASRALREYIDRLG